MSIQLHRIAPPLLVGLAFAAWWGLDTWSEPAPIRADDGGNTSPGSKGVDPGSGELEIRGLGDLREALAGTLTPKATMGSLRPFEFDLRVFGPGGIEHPIEPGFLSVELEVGEGGSQAQRELEFEGHRAPMLAPIGSVIHLLGAQVGPWIALPRKASIEFDGSPRVTLELDLALGGRIEVVDAGTQLPVREVWMRTAEGFSPQRTSTPPSHAYPVPTADRLPSPVYLPDLDLPWRAWIGGPGYRWMPLDLGGGQDPERIELEAGCTLEVQVAGMEPNAGRHHLRIEGLSDGQRIGSQVLKATSTELIHGLPPGSLRVSMDLERNVLPDHRLIFRDIELDPNGENRVELDLEDLYSTSELAVVHGLVRIPSNSALHTITIVTHRRDDDGSLGDRPVDAQRTRMRDLPPLVPGELFEWSAPGVPPGSYHLRIEPLGFEQELVLDRPGVHEVTLTVPEPTRRRLWIVEESGGAQVRPIHVLWRGVLQDGSITEWRPLADADAEGGWPLACLHGEVELLFAFEQGSPRTQRIELALGVSDVEVALDHSVVMAMQR